MSIVKATVLPLFSTPVYYIEDTTFRISNSVLEKLTNFKEIPGVFGENHPCQLTKDVHIMNLPELQDAKNLCEFHLQKYVSEVCGFSNEFYITNSWLSRNAPGMDHPSHVHPNSIVSGCLYLRSSPNSMFSLHDQTHFKKKHNFRFDTNSSQNIYNTESYALKVDTGALAIWPSDVLHSSNPNPLNDTRVVLCFNTFIKGKMGFSSDPNVLDAYAAELDLK